MSFNCSWSLFRLCIVALIVSTSCSTGEDGSRDAGLAHDATEGQDVAVSTELGGADNPATESDALADLVDTVPRDGFGEISGDCGFLDADALASPAPSLAVNRIDFGSDAFDPEEDTDLLTAGGLEVLLDENAGGSSLLSEVFAFELLSRCELATLIKTETEVCYTESSSITDLLVEIDGASVGVSVTRAFNYPPSDPLPQSEALRVLSEKLDGIESSTAAVCEEDTWVKQILVVLAYSDEKAETIVDAYESLSEGDQGDTVVIVTVTDGDDAFIY